MAVKNDAISPGRAASRRWLFGANVALMTVLAAAVLVGVNLLGHLRNARYDLTGGLSGHRISQRTKSVLAKSGKGQPIRITTVYASDDPETARKEYFPRVEDLCEELREYGKSTGLPIEAEHIISGNDQAKLRDRIQQKFGSAAGAYNEVVTLAQVVWKDVADTLTPMHQKLEALVAGDSWLGSFPTLANIASILRKDIKNIDDTKQEVDTLVRGEGIPRFSEANEKIKTLDNDLKQHMEQIQNWTKEVDKLARLLGDPNAEFIRTTRARLKEMAAKVADLKQIAGDPKNPEVPADPKPVLQNFAKSAVQFGDWLTAEAARMGNFLNEYPALRQHPKWQIKTGLYVVDLTAMLNSGADSLTSNSRALRNYLKQDVPLDQLQNLVRQTRQMAVQIGDTLDQWNESVTSVLDEGGKIDAQTKQFLADASGGQMFKKGLDRLNEVGTKIGKLPELKLDEVATRLQQENIIVVERGKDDVRVVSFDEAWPYADPFGRAGARGEEGTPIRVFDGDSAISDSLLAMVSDKPVAKVVFVAYEEEVPPQMRQYQRPLTGSMPLEMIRAMKEQLQRMHFKVEDWNIAGENAKDKKPKAEEGVPMVYVFLPPPPQIPPFAMRQQQQKQFGKQDAEVARQLLADGGRGIFLACYEQSMRGMPREYGWGPILREDWGIDVETDSRVIRGVVDRKQTGRYAIDIVQWWYMQLNSFTNQAIGEPLRARRMLMKDVCPVVEADKVPEGVKIEPVLEVPAGTTDIWADKDIERIFTALSTGAREGSFTKGPEATNPPFTVVLAAQKDEAGKAASQPTATASGPAPLASKIVVMGNGLSLRDEYLQQRVIRLAGKGGTRLATDPPPMENMDLLVNAVYWLSDHPELIAAGPAEVPVVAAIDPSSRSGLWVITMGWALVALVVGGIMWAIRRK